MVWLENNFIGLLISILLILSASSIIAVIVLSRRIRVTQIEWQSEIRALSQSVERVNAGSIGLGKKVLELEQAHSNLLDEQDELKSSSHDVAYLQAKSLIEQDVDDATIASSSGLGASEIHLMRILHSQRNSIEAYN